ncbi:MAG: protein-ADP-ribose hydrolase [Collinsella sp.]|nr:protein-ADP-ribose hydrolase [Collinsella sp.]
MTETEQLLWLITYLLEERGEAADAGSLPRDGESRWRLYRSLVNVRPPAPVSPAYRAIEDGLLRGRVRARGTASPADAVLTGGELLWQGDITTLAADAIVNAANAQMLGCFVPCHRCIDNAIHTAAGTELRLTCEKLIAAQEHEEPTGGAAITPGFNLPARHVIHTVGPIVTGAAPTAANREALARCYRSCLGLAIERDLASIAFCCISTGEFRFPHRDAAAIAIETVREERRQARAASRDFPTIIFNVFTDEDREIYEELLARSLT